MIAALFLPLLLQAVASPEDSGPSPFVDFQHQHNWMKLEEIEGGSVWWDKNFLERVGTQDEVYPLILIRIVFEPGASPFGRIDSFNAVDCEQTEFGPFNGTVPFYPRYIDKVPEFRPWANVEPEVLQQIMHKACGEDENS